MNFLNLTILKNLNLLKITFAIIVFFYSIYILQYHYDGHHIGLMYSNALDFNKGKLPYKEIFIQYGFLTTLIHSFILDLSHNKIFFLNVSTIFFYIFSVFLISETVKNFTDRWYGFLCFCILLANHPVPWLPWSNYIAFFFISLGIYLLSKENKSLYLIGLIFSFAVLSRQDYLVGIFASIFCFLFFQSFKKIKIYRINILKLILGFFFPIVVFILYLKYLGVYSEWVKYQYLPHFYMELYNVGIVGLIKRFIIFFTSVSFFNFINIPQYFLISVILISNTFFILIKIFNKLNINNNILYIVLLSLCLSSIGLNIELFRLYTSVSLGIIPLLFFIHKMINLELKKKFLFILILPSLFSIFFYPMGNNPHFTKIDFNAKIIDHKMDEFVFQKWSVSKVETLKKIKNFTKLCEVDYLENLTFDVLFSTIGDFDRIRLKPFESSLKDNKFHQYIETIKNPEKNFIDLINNEIIKENIILLINNKNYSFNNKKILLTNRYTAKKINLSSLEGKPDILRIYLPNKCIT